MRARAVGGQQKKQKSQEAAAAGIAVAGEEAHNAAAEAKQQQSSALKVKQHLCWLCCSVGLTRGHRSSSSSSNSNLPAVAIPIHVYAPNSPPRCTKGGGARRNIRARNENGSIPVAEDQSPFKNTIKLSLCVS